MSKSRKRRGGLPPSPDYKFTAQYLKVSFGLSWLVILAIVAGGLFGSEKADRLADIIVPSMVALIVALLGVHRAFGSVDFKSSQKHGSYAAEQEAGGYGNAYDGRQRNE